MNQVPQEIATEVLRLLGVGHSNRQIARVTGLALRTVGNLTAGRQRPPCPCGKPGGHKGWCGPRLAASPRRQQFMADFVEHVSIWTDAADAIVRDGWQDGQHEAAITAMVNALPLKVRVTIEAVKSRATVLKLRRPPGYMARLRREGRCGRRAGTPNKATWERFLRRLKPAAAIPAVAPERHEICTAAPRPAPSTPTPPQQAIHPTPAKAARTGYVGLLTGPDPFRAQREQAILNARKGKL
jgi:hypothetical protein